MILGADMELSFPVVTDAGFPWGLRCPLCDRSLEVGQPYTTHLEHADEFETITLITCVYCSPSEESNDTTTPNAHTGADGGDLEGGIRAD